MIINTKKSQVTLFIIIAIFIVVTILFYFLAVKNKNIFQQDVSFTQPEEYIKKCARDAASNATNLLFDTGGFLNPQNYILFESKKVSFICYTRTYYESCVMQTPLYINHLEEEIKSFTLPRVKTCLYDLKQEYERRGYDITYDTNPELIITLKPNKVDIDIKMNSGIVITKEDEVKRYENFKSSFNSPLYHLADLALEIASQEAKYCSFSTLGYSLFYPDTEVSVTPSSRTLDNPERIERGKIYTIKDRYTGKKLYFAIRSCEIPAGI
jgi:hypothetical protein